MWQGIAVGRNLAFGNLELILSLELNYGEQKITKRWLINQKNEAL